MKYVTTKEECERDIKGVCEGCGGKLSAIETVDNADQPTFWKGCQHCSCFREGVEPKYFRIARRLVEERVIIPYPHQIDREGQEDYYLSCQTAGLSRTIKYIERLLMEEDNKE